MKVPILFLCSWLYTLGYWDTGSELYVFIEQLLKLNWLYTELGDFLPVHYTPIFTPQTVGGFINNILAHHD